MHLLIDYNDYLERQLGYRQLSVWALMQLSRLSRDRRVAMRSVPNIGCMNAKVEAVLGLFENT